MCVRIRVNVLIWYVLVVPFDFSTIFSLGILYLRFYVMVLDLLVCSGSGKGGFGG